MDYKDNELKFPIMGLSSYGIIPLYFNMDYDSMGFSLE